MLKSSEQEKRPFSDRQKCQAFKEQLHKYHPHSEASIELMKPCNFNVKQPSNDFPNIPYWLSPLWLHAPSVTHIETNHIIQKNDLSPF